MELVKYIGFPQTKLWWKLITNQKIKYVNIIKCGLTKLNLLLRITANSLNFIPLKKNYYATGFIKEQKLNYFSTLKSNFSFASINSQGENKINFKKKYNKREIETLLVYATLNLHVFFHLIELKYSLLFVISLDLFEQMSDESLQMTFKDHSTVNLKTRNDYLLRHPLTDII